MTFRSILLARGDEPANTAEPAYFADLHLDQVVSAVIAEHHEFELAGLFYESLHDVEAVRDRQFVVRDLERDEVRERVVEFGRGGDGARSFKINEGRPLPTSYGRTPTARCSGQGIEPPQSMLEPPKG